MCNKLRNNWCPRSYLRDSCEVWEVTAALLNLLSSRVRRSGYIRNWHFSCIGQTDVIFTKETTNDGYLMPSFYRNMTDVIIYIYNMNFQWWSSLHLFPPMKLANMKFEFQWTMVFDESKGIIERTLQVVYQNRFSWFHLPVLLIDCKVKQSNLKMIWYLNQKNITV